MKPKLNEPPRLPAPTRKVRVPARLYLCLLQQKYNYGKSLTINAEHFGEIRRH